jgi:hypothetical protein
MFSIKRLEEKVSGKFIVFYVSKNKHSKPKYNLASNENEERIESHLELKI